METARKQALSTPTAFERSDIVVGRKSESGYEHMGNSLTDLVNSKEKAQPISNQGIGDLKEKIESIFEKYPHQYNLLGLYYAAQFTMDEISERIGYPKGHISRDLNRAKTRLKKYLTAAEYDSIRWSVGDVKTLQATERLDDSEYENARSSFAPSPTYVVEGPLKIHPPEKNLPVQRMSHL